jgi:hypothetical protein
MKTKSGASARKSGRNGVVHIPVKAPPPTMPGMADMMAKQHQSVIERSEDQVWGRVYASTTQVMIGSIKAANPEELFTQLAPIGGIANGFADGAIRRLRESRRNDFKPAPAPAPAAAAPATTPATPVEEKHS